MATDETEPRLPGVLKKKRELGISKVAPLLSRWVGGERRRNVWRWSWKQR